MADFPVKGEKPYGAKLQMYIDAVAAASVGGSSTDAGVAFQLANGSATNTEFTNQLVGRGLPPDGAALDALYGDRELAFAENRTGTATTFDVTHTPIPACTISIPPTERPVWLEWGAQIGISGPAPSQGAVFTVIYELTGGTAVAVDYHSSWVPSNAVATVEWDIHRGSTRVGPSTLHRVFALYAYVAREGGTNTLSAYVRNLATKYGSSFLTAVAR